MKLTKEIFLNEVKNHKMHIVLDEGVNRVIEFKNPETCNQWFGISTFNNHLVFYGDMGTYVFQKTKDMFNFFRSDELKIRPNYWHEKLQAKDLQCNTLVFDLDSWKELVKFHFEQIDCSYKEEKIKFLSDVSDESEARTCFSNYTDSDAWGQNFVGKEEEIYDLSVCDSYVYSHHFIWCCYAIVWAIKQYDESTQETLQEDVFVKINKKSFICDCGCNVFRKLIKNKNKYKCNACQAIWNGE